VSARGPDGEPALACPGCGAAFADGRRFCPDCGLPLVIPRSDGDDPPVSERHARARMIKPQLAEGEPVRVARAGNEAEAGFIQSLLLEAGVPSMVRRSAGFDVPDMLAAGPRDVLVPQSGAETAREVLLQARMIDAPAAAATGAGTAGAGVAPLKLLAGILVVLALGLLVLALASGGH
jgi:hypothetical protein